METKKIIINLFNFFIFLIAAWVYYPTDLHTDTETRFYWYTISLILVMIVTNIFVKNNLYGTGIFLFGLGLVYYLRFILHPININLVLMNYKNLARIFPEEDPSFEPKTIWSFTLLKSYTLLLSFFTLFSVYLYFST